MEPSNVCANDRVTKGIKGDIEEEEDEEDNDEDNNDDDIILVFLASIALSMASTAR
jgi:hypothetical protein